MKVLRLLLLFILLVCVGVGGAIVVNQRAFIYYPSKRQVAANYPGVTVEHIPTADGETLVAWYLPPPATNGVRGPIFLYFDGNAGRPESWASRWQQIQEGGAGFLAVYYRGYSGSTGHPSEAGLYEDARAGYAWLTAHDYAASDIVIHGFSLGAGPAVHLASERPARALVLEGAYTGVDDVARGWVGPLAALVVDRYPTRDFIPRVHMPVLIVHGDRDMVVPFAQGERLYTLANEPKQFVRIRGAQHATLLRHGLYDHIWTFLAQHPGS